MTFYNETSQPTQKLSLCNENFCFCHFMIFSDRAGTEPLTVDKNLDNSFQSGHKLFRI